MKKELLFLIMLLFAVGAWAQNTLNVGPGQTYTTIQAAITAATDGDIIQISEGTYTEPLSIGKSLTFIGSGPASNPTTILKSTGNVANLTVTGKSYSFQNLIIEGNGTNLGIRAGGAINIGTLELKDVIGRDCKVAVYLSENYSSGAFQPATVDELIFNNVTLTNNSHIGAYIGKAVISGTVTNSSFTNNGTTDADAAAWQKVGLQFVDFHGGTAPRVQVTNTTFSGNGTGASSIEKTGLSFYTAINFLSNEELLTVTGSTFEDHPQWAVRIRNGYSVGNTASVDGTFTTNYVDIWFNNVIGTTTTAALVRHTMNGIRTVGAGPTYDYSTIQAAINAASAGEVIEVAAGTYNESVTLKKSITLQGAGCGQTIWQGTAITGRSLLIQRNSVTPANVHVEISGFSFNTENNQSIRGDWSASYTEALTMDIHDNCFAHVNTRNPGNDFALYVDGANQTARGTEGAILVYDNTFNVTGGVLFEYCRAVDVIDNVFNVTYEAVTFNSYGTSGTIGEHLVDGNTFNHVPVSWAFAMNNWFGAGTYTVLPSAITNNVFTNTGFAYAVLVGVEASQSAPFDLLVNQNSILSGTITTWGDFANQAQIDATCNWWGTANYNEILQRVPSSVDVSTWLESEDLQSACSGEAWLVYNETTSTWYPTIQGAIDAAVGGNIIKVYPGTFNEATVINKPNLTIQSTGGRDVTFIENPNVGSETAGIAVVANMGIVTVEGFTVKNFRNGITQGMAASTGTTFIVKSNKVIPENNDTNPYLRNGIQVSGANSQVLNNYVVGAPLTSTWASTGIHVVNAAGVLVQGNTVNTASADIGIGVTNWDASLVENITIKENTVIGAKNSIRISGQNQSKAVKGVIIEDNTLTNSPSSSGINVQTVSLENLTVIGNVITGHDFAGVRFSSTSATLSGAILINENIISGNTDYGLYNGTTHPIDATCNWWGSSNYNVVMESNFGLVDFVSYLITDDIDTPVCTGDVWPVHNVTQNTYFQTIQPAITDAIANDVIEVAVGNYNETVAMGSMPLTLKGANDGVAGSGSRTAESVVTGGFVLNGSANVTIDGFAVTGSNIAGSRGILLGNTSVVPGPINLINNIIENWTTSISLAGGATYPWVSNVTLSGNLIRNNTAGIGSTENVGGLAVSNNTFSSNAEGIGLGTGLTGFTLSGNTFETNNTVYIASYGAGLMPSFSSIFAGNSFVTAAGVSSVTGLVSAIYPTIGAAITNANMGATIEVAAGTYNEDLLINKNINLHGAGANQTILTNRVRLAGPFVDVSFEDFKIERSTAPLLTAEYGAPSFDGVTFEGVEFLFTGISTNPNLGGRRAITLGFGIDATIIGDGLTFKDVIFESTNPSEVAPIMILRADGGANPKGPLTFDNVTVKGSGTYNAINTYDGGNVTVTNSKTENGGSFYLSGFANLTVTGNEFTGKGGVFVNGVGTGATITGNTFKDIVTGGYPAINFSAAWGPTQNNNVTFSQNKFVNVDVIGIRVYNYTSGDPNSDFLTATLNDFSGVSGIVISNPYSSFTVDATSNKWNNCPSFSGEVEVYPYYTTVNGTPGDFGFSGQVNNITASAVGFAGEITVCFGQTVTLEAGNGSNFLWEGLGLGATKVVRPTVTTTYNVTGTDTNGCPLGYASVTVNVEEAPVVSIAAEVVGEGTQLTASGAETYLWSPGGETDPVIVVNPDVTTTYTVVGTTAAGCSGTDSYVVTVVTVSAGPNQFICAGEEVTLTATVTGDDNPEYSWMPGGAITQSITVNPAETTLYTVTVNGGPSASVKVFVNPKPIANAGPDKILVNGSATLNGSATSGTAPYTYAWTGPSSFTSSVQNPSVTLAGTYELIVTDAFGCVSVMDDVDVTAPLANTYTVSGNVAYAFGTVNEQMHDVEVTLVGTNSEGTFIGYTAATGPGNFAIPGVPDGTYKVYLNSPKPWGGVTSADVTAIQNHHRTSRPVLLHGIKRLAADVVENSSSHEINVHDRNTVNFRRLGTISSFATGDWVFTRAADIALDVYPIDYANSIGYSDIEITVNGANLTDVNFKSLCYGDVNASYTGLKVLEIEDLPVYNVTAEDWFELDNYPNPFAGQTTIRYNQPVEGNAIIQVFNMMGDLIATIDSPSGNEGNHEIIFDGHDFAPGLYFYTLTLTTSDDVMVQTGKMIITK